MTDEELFGLLNIPNTIFKPITPDILKHLPKTHKEFTLCCYEKENGDKFMVYYNVENGTAYKGPGMYSSSSDWETLAKEIKIWFNITKRKTKK